MDDIGIRTALDSVMVDHPIWGDREFTNENEAVYAAFVEDCTSAVLASLMGVG